ncbi:YesL family protein [Amycolatopsis orientalis]|uniref:YesL family protein n=1 Tax=Amycolatopsis orientalis TaxID=31958 RepID=UPI0009DD425D|nr:YesL family protein [Amycolatopsis orientalis]
MKATRLDRLTEFSDCLLLGMLVCLGSVPVVTAGPAFAAGCAVARRWRDGDSPPMFPAFRDAFVRHLPGGVPFSAAAVAVITVLCADLALFGAGLPGGRSLAVVLALLLAASVVVVLRTCSVVAPGEGWRAALRTAVYLSRDVRGSALLAAAVGVAGFVVWMQPLMLLIVAGPLTLAAAGTAP